jgi:hypothetical protein
LRFLENGPIIPDDLLTARDEWRIVFFCGAGVSRARAGLVDFFGPTKAVAERLAVAPESPTYKLLAALPDLPPIEGLGSYISADRVFGMIEREFAIQDIYRAIATSLKPPNEVDLSAHKYLLDLAKGPDGRTRLITTNFDNLFDRCDERLSWWIPPRLPDPLRPDDFHGIVHLHGRSTTTIQVPQAMALSFQAPSSAEHIYRKDGQPISYDPC